MSSILLDEEDAFILEVEPGSFLANTFASNDGRGRLPVGGTGGTFICYVFWRSFDLWVTKCPTTSMNNGPLSDGLMGLVPRQQGKLTTKIWFDARQGSNLH